MQISASQARRELLHLIQRVNEDRRAIEIVSPRGNVMLVGAKEYAVWQETAHLFRSPANARRLLDAYQRASTSQDGARR
uniref:type II toxin-antitoxin system Phd/YefM family antitoxin n=1 Tax=Tessaracoccus timonensis TaxID=2161816 RepID=UPI000D5617A6|nr:type II toxin-antitoxin system prevent-host-death family antitoxin [Tessaracoccus timonensis]